MAPCFSVIFFYCRMYKLIFIKKCGVVFTDVYICFLRIQNKFNDLLKSKTALEYKLIRNSCPRIPS